MNLLRPLKSQTKQFTTNLKSVLLFSILVFFLIPSCNSSDAKKEDVYPVAKEDFEKIKVSQELSPQELELREMVKLVSNLFSDRYSLQTKARRNLMEKYSDHLQFAEELSREAIIYLSKENDKFDQYNVVLLLAKASEDSIYNGRESVRKYIMKIENKEYVGPKMSKNISIVKSKLN